MTEPITLYGLPHSLYTGKLRSYLRKQGIDYREVAPANSCFAEHVVPQIGRVIIPVIELDDGTIVQDTVDIIDHFEGAGVRWSAYPEGAAQRAVSHLFELYSVAVLTRHAMHYRWSYLEKQENFLRDAFGLGSDPERTETTMRRMHSYLPMLGVTEETIPAIEESYLALLANLERHFARFPYLLGNRPSIGDYSLLGPLYAHLRRDPVPLGIMQNRSPKTFRWVERMNAPDLDLVGYDHGNSDFFPDDEIPATLLPLLDQMAAELLPGLTDGLSVLRDHVEKGHAIPGEPVTDKPHRRVIGQGETTFRGASYVGGVQPYVFFLWQRLRDSVGDDANVLRLFEERSLAPLLQEDLPIRVDRSRNIEVWGERS